MLRLILKKKPNKFQYISKCYVSQLKSVKQENRKVERGPTKMMGSEAFVETLVSHGVKDVFGIVGSAFMDPLDLMPEAGIRFIPTQHEQNAGHMADGYSRVSGNHGVCIGQNGPGITNFVTPLAAAYWAHSPVVAITPECATIGKGLGGFQEVDQMPIFEPITKYQANIVNGARMAELTSRAFDIAMHERGPTQINIPRDLFYHECEYVIPYPKKLEYSSGGVESIKHSLKLLQEAKNPVILAGGGVIMSKNDAIQHVKELAHFLKIPVATTYLHNDSYPSNDPYSVGPLGYQGHKAAMNCIHDADLILAIGTRLSPFGTLPQYEFDYWPKDSKIIQIDIDSRRLGLSKSADVHIEGDSGLVTQNILNQLKNCQSSSITCLKKENKSKRVNKMNEYKKSWEELLNKWTSTSNCETPHRHITPRQALRELEKVMPKNAMVSTDIGNICSVSNSYLRFSNESPSFLAAMTFGNCQYALGSAMGAKVAKPDRFALCYAGDGAWGMSFNEILTCTRENIPVTSVVFNNGQWGAEKKNQVLWFGDRYIGVNLKHEWSYAKIAESMNAQGIRCDHIDQVGDALLKAIDNQMNHNKTTVIEIMVTKELGDPFRRDAMKLPRRHLDKYKSTIQQKESSTGQVIDKNEF